MTATIERTEPPTCHVCGGPVEGAVRHQLDTMTRTRKPICEDCFTKAWNMARSKGAG